MKNIRYIYTFHFYGKGIDVEVKIKAQTLKDLYFKILEHEPALERLSDRAWNCTLTKEHKRRFFSPWFCRNYSRSFLPHDVMEARDYNRVLNGK